MPRGLYDGPVHEVMLPAKPGGSAQARTSCPGKVSVPPVRNLHRSGFSLSGEWGRWGLPWAHRYQGPRGWVVWGPGAGPGVWASGETPTRPSVCPSEAVVTPPSISHAEPRVRGGDVSVGSPASPRIAGEAHH